MDTNINLQIRQKLESGDDIWEWVPHTGMNEILKFDV